MILIDGNRNLERLVRQTNITNRNNHLADIRPVGLQQRKIRYHHPHCSRIYTRRCAHSNHEIKKIKQPDPSESFRSFNHIIIATGELSCISLLQTIGSSLLSSSTTQVVTSPYHTSAIFSSAAPARARSKQLRDMSYCTVNDQHKKHRSATPIKLHNKWQKVLMNGRKGRRATTPTCDA